MTGPSFWTSIAPPSQLDTRPPQQFGLCSSKSFNISKCEALASTESLSIAECTQFQAHKVLIGHAPCRYKWDSLPAGERPERGLLGIRAGLQAFANLRPATVLPQLVDASSLKPEVVSGVDIMIVRELVGDIYFGQPRVSCCSDHSPRALLAYPAGYVCEER